MDKRMYLFDKHGNYGQTLANMPYRRQAGPPHFFERPSPAGSGPELGPAEIKTRFGDRAGKAVKIENSRPYEEHHYSELTRSTCKALFMVFTPWVLFSSFIMTSFSSLWAFYSVFHSTLAGCCTFCAIVAYDLDRKVLRSYSLPPLLLSFCLTAPMVSLPFLSHELGKNSGQWGGDFYLLASLILGGQIYWLLLPVVLGIIFFGPKRLLTSCGYAILFLGLFNFAIFICLISLGPLIFDFVQDARLLFSAMLCFRL